MKQFYYGPQDQTDNHLRIPPVTEGYAPSPLRLRDLTPGETFRFDPALTTSPRDIFMVTDERSVVNVSNGRGTLFDFEKPIDSIGIGKQFVDLTVRRVRVWGESADV